MTPDAVQAHPPSPDADEVTRLIKTALARRSHLVAADYPVRVFDRAADGLPRLVVEKFNDAWRVSGGPERAALLPAIRAALGDPARLYYRFGHEERGGPDDGVCTVREGGLAYEVALLPNRHTGLFLEARDARAWVRGSSEGRRVLNLFAYTCAFGVAAAAGRARSTTNVDTAPTALERGRRNYALNDLPTDTRTFWRSEVREALRRGRKAGSTWDGIVLHPPPLETGKRGQQRLDAVRDLEKLTAACRAVLAPGGWLLLAWAPTALTNAELHAAAGLGQPEWRGGCGEDFNLTPEQPGLRAFAYRAPTPSPS